MSRSVWDWYEQELLGPSKLRGLGTLLALSCAMGGQYSLAHSGPDRWLLGVMLYVAGSALIVRGLWTEAGRERSDEGWDCVPCIRPEFKLERAMVGVVLAFITYLAVRDNRFTVVGVLAWVGSLWAFGASLWHPSSSATQIVSVSGRVSSRRVWTVFIMVAVLLLGAVLRFAMLNELPREMTSDHVEKLHDVAKIVDGSRPIFLPANGGREPMQFYAAALAATWLGMGISYFTLKFTMALAGLLTIPFVYLLGLETCGDRRTGLTGALLFAVGWWPVIISRNGLRFPLAPLFATVAIYLVIRGLRRGHPNLFLIAGITLGLGFYGYTPFRIMPLVVMVLCALYVTHNWQKRARVFATRQFMMAGVIAAAGVLPLFRYSMDDPDAFWYRTVTRVGEAEIAHTNPMSVLFLRNAWDSMRMFSWTSDAAWLVSPSKQPALDWMTSALFHLGMVVVLTRYIRRRSWLDLFLLVSVPLLMLPSTMALAFPVENPSLTRSGMAQPIVFLVAAVGLTMATRVVERGFRGGAGALISLGVVGVMMLCILRLNAGIVFENYRDEYAQSAQNSSEIGHVVRQYAESIGSWDTVWVRAYPYWVDTRAVGIYAGRFGWDNVILNEPEEYLHGTLSDQRNKLFVLNQNDLEMRELLWAVYPNGHLRKQQSAISPSKDFLLFLVSEEN